MGKSTEEVLLMCRQYLATCGSSKPYQHAVKELDNAELANVDKLIAVKQFAQQRRRPPNALIAWIDEAIDHEKE